MTLDDIGFGTPTIQHLKLINTETYLDKLFSELTAFTFPKNSSDATKEELNTLVNLVTETQKDEEAIRRYYQYDGGLKKVYLNALTAAGINPEKSKGFIEAISTDIGPLILKLKFFFQRPRPQQLAYYYKLRLMPFRSVSADTPSFPSGHAYQAKIFSTVLGNNFPQLFADMQSIFLDVCESRMAMGLHYQSDIDVGIFAAERVLRNKEFAIKYKI